MRLSSHHLAQQVDANHIVVMDESAGEEVLMDFETARALRGALDYFLDGANPADTPQQS